MLNFRKFRRHSMVDFLQKFMTVILLMGPPGKVNKGDEITERHMTW